LFDEAGLPFLLTWSPAYIGIPVDGEPGGDGDGPGGGNPFSFSSFDLPLGPGDLGNPGTPGGPGNLGDSGDLGDGRTDTPFAPLFDNPLAGPPANLSTEELPKVEDVDQGSQQRAAPEPAALLLIGAGLSAAAAIRRRSR
jgi:hypothetical protein